MSQNTKIILSNLFTLTSELSEPTSNLIHIEGTNERSATQKDLAKGLHENLIVLTEALGFSVDELTEQQEDEPQETVRTIIEEIQKLTHKPYEVSEGDLDVYSDIISGELDRLLEAIGLTDLSITAKVKDKLPENTLKAQIQDLHALNDSMFTGDPNYIPRFTDGTPIRPQDLADMNINALDNIAELIGFELEE